MELEIDDCVHKILPEFQNNGITLVEWETPLLRRLSYPLAPKPVHSIFDTSYEGDYMPLPEDEDLTLSDEEKARWAERDAMELEAAIKSINQWHFAEGTEWAKDMMIELVSGKLLL